MKKGFTLIEMLIVIAIISILASVFLVGLRGFRGGAYDSRRIADLQKTQSYLELYYTQNRAYPNSSAWNALETTLKTSANLPGIPHDPLVNSGNLDYGYCYSSDAQSYILAADLSSGDSSIKKEQPTISTSGYTCTRSLDCSSTSKTFCTQF